MTINFELLDKLENDRFFIFLARINQISTTWLIDNLTEDIYSHFEAQSWIKHIKSKSKKEHLYNSLRLSDKGRNYLRDLFKEQKGNDDDRELLDWLIEYYRIKGKDVGNPNRTLDYMVKFRLETGIEKNNLAILIKDFLQDPYVEDSSKVLEFAFFYPKKITTDNGRTIAYETRWDLHDSWLFKHYQKNKQKLETLFER
jgi:hypothetical protein